MKNWILFTLLTLLVLSVYAQNNKPVAIDDKVFFEMEDTLTVYPLLNDYYPEGGQLIIESYSPSYNINIISETDTSVTLCIPEYFIGGDIQSSIRYHIQYEGNNTNGSATIYLIPNVRIDTLSVNNIKTTLFPQNVQFYDAYFRSLSPNYLFPATAKTSPLFSSSLWIGGKDHNGDLHLAAEKYRQNGADFWSGPLSVDGLALTDSVNATNWFRTWKVSKKEVDMHIANYLDPTYVMPEAIENWPAHGDPNSNQNEFLAPFADVDFDLEYHPENGDYPLIKGDESVFFIYNDRNEFHSETEGDQMGVEIQCMAWAFENINGKQAYSNTIFLSYKIFNRSMQTYYDTYIGIFTDLDLGYANDDYIGCNVENGNYYVYNGREIDGAGEPTSYGENPPTQGVCILGGPFMDDDGIDNPLGECNESINGAGFADGIIDNERYGMTRANLYIGGSSPYGSDNAADYYNYMQGNWKDGNPMVYGGNAHQSSGGDSLFPTRFMYPGDSDPCNWGTGGAVPTWDSLWTEETAGNLPFDRRGMASTGPFTFQAGSVHYLDIALVTAPGDQETPSKDLLQEYIAQIKQDYLLNPEEFGNQYLSIPEETKLTQQLLVYPNPADGDIIRFELNNEQEAEYFIYNAAGQIIENGSLSAQKEHFLNIGYLQSGWYILEVKAGGKVLRSKLIL